MNQAAQDVLAERERQKAVEGWSEDHDDAYLCGELSQAAACYADAAQIFAQREGVVHGPGGKPYLGSLLDRLSSRWPFGREWWKPTNIRRCLVKAAALLLAEIERIDRKAAKEGDQRAA